MLFPVLCLGIEVLTIDSAQAEIESVPRGIPYRIRIEGKGPRSYTLTEIADGTGLSLSIVSLMLRGLRPLTPYTQARLAAFFGIGAGELCAINVSTPQPRVKGRIVARIHRHSYY